MGDILVYGGCVSRDAAGRVAPHEVSCYIARQSLISGMAAPSSVPSSVAQLNSSFQRRAVTGDFASSLQAQVRRHADAVDVMVMDILVERFGVFPLPEGKFVTRSAEFKRAGLDKRTPGIGGLMKLGAEGHEKLWLRSAERFEVMMRRLGVKNRAVVLELPWAEWTVERTRTQASSGMTAQEANGMFAPYYAHLRDLGFDVFRLPDDLVMATKNHKWGEEPFHYAEPAYEWIADLVREKAHRREE